MRKSALRDISRLQRERKKINFLINPTIYEDFDIIAVGQKTELHRFTKKNKGSHFIKKSVWGFPLVVIDTCNTIEDAVKIIANLMSRN